MKMKTHYPIRLINQRTVRALSPLKQVSLKAFNSCDFNIESSRFKPSISNIKNRRHDLQRLFKRKSYMNDSKYSCDITFNDEKTYVPFAKVVLRRLKEKCSNNQIKTISLESSPLRFHESNAVTSPSFLGNAICGNAIRPMYALFDQKDVIRINALHQIKHSCHASYSLHPSTKTIDQNCFKFQNLMKKYFPTSPKPKINASRDDCINERIYQVPNKSVQHIIKMSYNHYLNNNIINKNILKSERSVESHHTIDNNCKLYEKFFDQAELNPWQHD